MNFSFTHDPSGTLDLDRERAVYGSADVCMSQEPQPNRLMSYREVTGSLFPHLPTMKDVNQRSLGNCSLLATVLSILTLEDASDRLIGPHVIEGMMKEQANGQVLVRLFNPDKVVPDPRYYMVRKRIIHSWVPGVVFHAGTVWIAMLEKAVATALRSTTPGSRTYKVLEPGPTPDVLYKMLLGFNRTKSREISARPEGEKVAFLNRLMGGGLTEDDKFVLNLIFRSSGSPDALTENVLAWHARRPHADREWAKASSVKKHTVLRMEDVADFMEKHRQDVLLGDSITGVLRWIETDRVLPGKRGTFKYSQDQIVLFDKIAKHLARKQPVTAGSNPEGVGSSKSLSPFAGPEVKSKGLASAHMYAVLEAIRSEDGGRWLRMRNPWGNADPKLALGRDYVQQQSSPDAAPKLKAVAVANSEFVLELSDFTKRFTKVFFVQKAV
jgi:Calpain family cysteine protease